MKRKLYQRIIAGMAVLAAFPGAALAAPVLSEPQPPQPPRPIEKPAI